MRYPPYLLDEIRKRLPVSQVVGEKVALKQKGREFCGLSPFKVEKTPSFFVNDQKGFYHCFASGEHGDIFSFLVKTEGVSFQRAIEKLAKRALVALPVLRPPKAWPSSSDFRLFISHVSEDSDKAVRLKHCFTAHKINAFVAHDDIEPTLDWQMEIEHALQTMDAFLAIHTPGFSKSNWTQQEIGFAVGRGVKVISFKMGEDPTGFISKQQALPRRGRSAEQIASEVAAILAEDPQTRDILKAATAARRFDDDIPF